MTSSDKENFLKEIHAEAQVHVVDFMKTWYKFDTNRSGYLENDEIKKFLESILEQYGKLDLVDKYLDCVMKCFDTNNDGKIGLNEFAQIVPVEHNFLDAFKDDLSTEEFEKIFQHYDKDNNDRIEGDELMAFLLDLKRTQIESEEELAIPNLNLDSYKEFIMKVCENQDGRFSKHDLRVLMVG